MNFVSRYLARSKEVGSILCVGLDLTSEHIPPQFGDQITGVEAYGKKVIEIASKKVAVVKLQYACYAAMGVGSRAIPMIGNLAQYAHSLGLLVVLDVKRSDIGDTMEWYGVEVFVKYGADGATFNPYPGPTFMATKKTKSWMPWLEKGCAVICLVRTSNPEASVIQDVKLEGGLFMYEHVADLVGKWNSEVRAQTNGEGSVCAVVGATATSPEQARSCRRYAGDDVLFLKPGLGAQGGNPDDAIAGLVNSRGEVMGFVNDSRGITRDSWRTSSGEAKPGDPLDLVAEAIDTANTDLNRALTLSKGGKNR